ncbi:uncharacterized protein ACR2FA_003748 [Aphomia sociella]
MECQVKSKVLLVTASLIFSSVLVPTNPKIIGTHDGIFHCDEALACSLLKMLPQYRDAEIIRTRDPDVLKECHIIVDVGGVFDRANRRYDHHQISFNETLSSLRPDYGDKYNIKLSSVGLVYTYYGEQLIQNIASTQNLLNTTDLRSIYKKVYENLIQEIDALDNGIPMTNEKSKYTINTYLSARVRRMNPQWNSEQDIDMDELFGKAMALVSEEFMYTVNYYINVWLPAKKYLKSALENRFHTHKSGQIVELSKIVPWKEHLFEVETEINISNEIKYIIFNSKPETWFVLAVPVIPTSFILRKPLHKNWWGLSNETLSNVSGIAGCIFCHASGFLCGNISKEGALKMAVVSLELLTKVNTFIYCNSIKQRHFCVGHQNFRGFINKMKIGTHDGVFHCDDVLACYMLKKLAQYKDAEIVRTRDPEKLKECDIVVDVGAVFDHDKRRYDHHQREFNETLSTLKPALGDKYKIKLSSAGLVYTYYGEQLIQQLAPNGLPLNPSDLSIIYKKVYENFIEEIDAIDNGVPMTEEEPKYKIRTHLSARIARLNPEWNTSQQIDIKQLFQKAMTLAGEEFLHTINYFTAIWLPARDYVKSAIDSRFDVHVSGQILEFTDRFPWKEHLFDLEAEMEIGQEIKYILFNDKPNSWRVQVVPVSPSSFIARKSLHKSWWGVRDEVLSDVAQIEGCIFCHSTGFIGGNISRDGALKMAVASLEAAT